jgi:EamA domain-containing membrane protein RarD
MVLIIGTICFGLLVGYITYRTLARTDEASISDLAAVVGAVGGGVVTSLVRPHTDDFGWYSIGLAAGFAGYGIIFLKMNGKAKFARVMGNSSVPVAPDRGPNAPRPPGEQ